MGNEKEEEDAWWQCSEMTVTYKHTPIRTHQHPHTLGLTIKGDILPMAPGLLERFSVMVTPSVDPKNSAIWGILKRWTTSSQMSLRRPFPKATRTLCTASNLFCQVQQKLHVTRNVFVHSPFYLCPSINPFIYLSISYNNNSQHIRQMVQWLTTKHICWNLAVDWQLSVLSQWTEGLITG